jgi:hypothetical protein
MGKNANANVMRGCNVNGRSKGNASTESLHIVDINIMSTMGLRWRTLLSAMIQPRQEDDVSLG